MAAAALQSGIEPPGTYRDPIARSAPRSTAPTSAGSAAGSWEPSASISTITSYPSTRPLRNPARYADPRPDFAGRRSTSTPPISSPTSVASSPVPSGLESSITSTSARGSARLGSARGESVSEAQAEQLPASPFRHRGVIEGFYGTPWAHEDRLHVVSQLGAWGMNRYVYAPKDDPLHRSRWREPYPEEWLARFAELRACGARAGVEVGTAISPGLSIRYAAADERRELCEKLRAFRRLHHGVAHGAQLVAERRARGARVVGDQDAHGKGAGTAYSTQPNRSTELKMSVSVTMPMIFSPWAMARREKFFSARIFAASRMPSIRP